MYSYTTPPKCQGCPYVVTALFKLDSLDGTANTLTELITDEALPDTILHGMNGLAVLPNEVSGPIVEQELYKLRLGAAERLNSIDEQQSKTVKDMDDMHGDCEGVVRMATITKAGAAIAAIVCGSQRIPNVLFPEPVIVWRG